MHKFKIGKLYRVGNGMGDETGNIIRIKEEIANDTHSAFRYEIVSEKMPRWFHNTFETGSIFAKSLTPVEEKIVIYRNDNKVVAVNKVTGKEGVARCAPDDTFNFETVAKLAFKRLVGEDAAESAKPEGPKFKVGEFVRVVSAKGHHLDNLHGFPIGRIVKVVRVMNDNEYKCEGVIRRYGEYMFGTQIVRSSHIEKLGEA
jgi:hypothetical protein